MIIFLSVDFLLSWHEPASATCCCKGVSEEGGKERGNELSVNYHNHFPAFRFFCLVVQSPVNRVNICRKFSSLHSAVAMDSALLRVVLLITITSTSAGNINIFCKEYHYVLLNYTYSMQLRNVLSNRCNCNCGIRCSKQC